MSDERLSSPAPDPQHVSSPVRIFSLPEEFRTMPARAKDVSSSPGEPVLPADPILIPMPFPVQAQESERAVKRGVGGWVLGVGVLLLVCAGAFGMWWYVTRLQAPEQPVPPPVTPPVIVESPDTTPTEPYPGTDTDSDGLTNKEELLYGTDFRAPDTDGDTFLDGNEVFHRYDPNGLAPSTLLDTGSVRVLEREEMPFMVFYPASWDVSLLAESARVSFRSSSTASIVMRWEEKDTLMSLDDWMEDQDISLKNTESSMTKEGYIARSSHDGRTSHLDLGSFVVVAEYDVGDAMSIDFLQTFSMMLNSVEVVTVLP